MKVPLLDLKAHHEPLQKELLDRLEAVLRSQTFILGAEVALRTGRGIAESTYTSEICHAGTRTVCAG